MKKGISNIFGAIFMGTALLAVPSCTDTWEEHYTADESNAATKTVWELMQEKPELSNFCSVISKAKFYRDEQSVAYTLNGTDTVYYTYKDVLLANTPVTVWAPNNDALSVEEWAELEKMAEEYPYNLQQQFVCNHIALYRKTMTKPGSEPETIRLSNSKFATINYAEGQFGKFNESYVTEANIGATNGLLHVIDSKNEFPFNLYEYIKYSGKVKCFRDYLVERDTLIFNQGASIEGFPDENGNPTYVDSSYTQNNLMFDLSSYNPTQNDANDEWMTNMKMFHAQINTEDSAFVMIIPTDKAWKETTERLKPYYKYVDAYPKMNKLVTTPEATYLLTLDKARAGFANGMQRENDPQSFVDSLQVASIEMDMIYPLVFNARVQRGNGGVVWTAQQFVDNYPSCEYLLTTTGDTIRDVYKEVDGVKQKVWEMASLLKDGVVEVKEMSNGYAIITDTWNFPSDYFMRDVDVETNSFVYKKVTSSTVLADKEMNNILAKDWIDDYGRVSQQRYLHVKSNTATAENRIVFQLNGSKYGQADVMSGKYDIMAVMVPTWYNSSAETPDIPKKISQSKLTFNLYYWDETLKEAAASKGYGYSNQTKYTVSWDFHNQKVDTLILFEDFEFPVSYRNVRNSYPVLEIVSKVTTTQSRNGYTAEYCIDRIILKSKESE